jgi:hypothetical protein
MMLTNAALIVLKSLEEYFSWTEVVKPFSYYINSIFISFGKKLSFSQQYLCYLIQ